MIRRTLAEVRPELSRIAGESGMALTDTRFLKILNRATEELMSEGDWPGVVDRYRFAAYSGLITLPGDLNRIMAVAVDDVPIEMRSDWYEFMQAGPGIQDSNSWLDAAIDRGEACTFRDMPDEGYKLKVVTQVDERVATVRPTINVQGYDEDGGWIRSESGGVYSDGLKLELNGDTGARETITAGDVTALEAVIKPVTRGEVSLYAHNNSESVHLATYAPRETHPSYRRYFIPFLVKEEESTVLIRARRRFVPIREESDFLIITNLPALESMIMAIRRRETDNLDDYFKFRMTAIKLLQKEAEAYRGKSNKPVITFGRGFGMDGVHHVQ